MAETRGEDGEEDCEHLNELSKRYRCKIENIGQILDVIKQGMGKITFAVRMTRI